MEGPRGTDHNQGQEAGLIVRWDIPNVLVKDVPNFELLSPELEAGTVPFSFPSPAWSYLPSPYQMSSVAEGFFCVIHSLSVGKQALRGGTQQLFLSAIRVLSPSLCLGKTGLCSGHSEVPRDKQTHMAGGIPQTPQWEVPVKEERMRIWAELTTWAKALGLERLSW